MDFSKGEEKGGHEPIYPTNYSYLYRRGRNSINERGYEKEHLYYIICFYYFASLSPPLKYETKEYILKVSDYSFKGSSSEIP